MNKNRISDVRNQHAIRLIEPEVEDILAAHIEVAGSLDAMAGYEGHVMRMLNIMRHGRQRSSTDYRKLVIAAAFHDLDVFVSLDYLESSNRKAMTYLAEQGLDDWRPEVALIIHNHHGIKTYRRQAAALVEPFRQADWIEVSVGVLNFGQDRSFLRELRREIPYGSFYPGQIFRSAFRWWRHHHPFDPLPNFRTNGADHNHK
jgi:hypothetical protein